MELEMRPVAQEELREWLRAESRAYGRYLDEAELPSWRTRGIDPERTLAVFDGAKIVGTTHSSPYEMTVPGGRPIVAGVDYVSVEPTHRRRGLLTRMMARQLEELHELGEPLAALWASESIIYGRFGYGVGAYQERWTIDKQHTAFSKRHEPTDSLTLVDPQNMRKTLPEVYRRAIADRPAAIDRPGPKWDRIAADAEFDRRGASPYFHVIHEREGQRDGYVTYRVKDRTLHVVELMSVSYEAYAALWRYCFDMDLRTATEVWNRPVDDPLPWMLADPRRLERSRIDGLWVRLVDVCVALSERRYEQADRLVIEVKDRFCPWNGGRYVLDGGPEGVECRSTSATPDLVLSAGDMAAAYLGTVRFTTLSRAGRVGEHTPGALARADAMFAVRIEPWCPYQF